MAKTDLSAEYLRELVNYDPDTGLFTWRIKPASRIKVGAPIGCVIDGGYLRVTINRNFYRLHRLAWLYVTGEWPRHDIDHIDGNPSNNAISNLRDVSRTINTQNKRGAMGHNKSSGLLGVSKPKNKWRARITFDGIEHTTYHQTKEEACAAYLASKRMHHVGNTL